MAEQDEVLAELEAEFSAGYEDIAARPFSEQFPRCKVKVEITNAFLNRSSGEANRKQLVATCTILECSAGEEFVNRTYSKSWGLENEQNLEWLKRDMLALDVVPPKNPKDLLRVANELTGIIFAAQLVPNKTDSEQYPANMWINRGARISDGADAGEEAF